MEKTIHIYKNHNDLSKYDRDFSKSLSPEERLNQVELLRMEAGKFLYEYPTRLRRIIKITRRTKS
jgi:hypothetical protein